MKKTLLFLALSSLAISLHAQDYLDVLKVSHGRATFENVDESDSDVMNNDGETEVSNTLVDFLFPIPVSSKVVAVGGFTYENTRLGLGFNDNFRSNLVMTRLNLGVKITHKKNWTGTYVVLPKIASDFDDLGSDDYQFGAIALLEKKYTSRYGLKFGTYVSSENFGTTVTPLLGLWYKSKNRKFYVNAVLPIRADINYTVANHFSVGANLLSSIKSYNLSATADADVPSYVQEESIRFALFAAYGLMDDMIIIRAKAGFDTTDYSLYAQSDNKITQVLTSQIGDERTRLNQEFESALFVGFDLIWRLDI